MKCPENRPSCSACLRVKQVCSYLKETAQSSETSVVDHDGRDNHDTVVEAAEKGSHSAPVAVETTRTEAPRDGSDRIAKSVQKTLTQRSEDTVLANSDDSMVEQEHDVDDTERPLANEPRTSPPLNHPAEQNDLMLSTELHSLQGQASELLPGMVRFESNPVESQWTQASAYAPAHTPTEAWAVGSVSSAGNIESDTAGWFGLLFEDAVSGNENLPLIDFETDGRNIFGNWISEANVQVSGVIDTPQSVVTSTSGARAETSNKSLLERVPRLGRDQIYEKQSWHSSQPINLLPQEQFLFQYFVRHISQWVRAARHVQLDRWMLMPSRSISLIRKRHSPLSFPISR